MLMSILVHRVDGAGNSAVRSQASAFIDYCVVNPRLAAGARIARAA
ncbi:hypothetical protein BURKHO8Y_140336 [Burkholderia sp. 8Y]|nr:hypothetical protein BURKHO8Y_140336 [Burkholderia sp. 8Y]